MDECNKEHEGIMIARIGAAAGLVTAFSCVTIPQSPEAKEALAEAAKFLTEQFKKR